MSDETLADLNAGMPTHMNGTLALLDRGASASVRTWYSLFQLSLSGGSLGIADHHLLAVVGAHHDDDSRRLLGFDEHLDLVRPVVEIVAHEARRSVGAVDDLDVGILGKGGRQALGETARQEIADDQDYAPYRALATPAAGDGSTRSRCATFSRCLTLGLAAVSCFDRRWLVFDRRYGETSRSEQPVQQAGRVLCSWAMLGQDSTAKTAGKHDEHERDDAAPASTSGR